MTFTLTRDRRVSSDLLILSTMSNTGGADLSLSELSLKEQPEPQSKEKPRSKSKPRPFTLLAHRSPSPESEPEEPEKAATEEDVVEEGDADEGGADIDEIKNSKKRDEKLQHDLFVLRRLNESFKAYNSALDASGSATSVSSVSKCRCSIYILTCLYYMLIYALIYVSG